MKILFTIILASFFLFSFAFCQSGSNMAVDLNSNSISTGDYLSPGDVLNMGTNDFTIEVKVSVDSFPPKSDYGSKIINKGLSTSGTPQNAGYGLRIWDDNGVNELLFLIGDGSNIINLTTDSLLTATCYHIAAVREGDNVRLYLDGNLVADSNAQSVLDVNTDLFFTIGALSRQPIAITTEFFDGQIDEVRIWNVVRDETHIKAMMNDTLNSAYYSSADSGLIAYYRCDEFEDLGVGGDGSDDVRDLSINSYHADSYDAPAISPTCTVVGINYGINRLPDNYELMQNFPNPFNPTTKIRFLLGQPGFTTLKIYDLLGKEIATLVSEKLSAGPYKIDWDASNYSSSFYFYQLKSGSFIQTKKMLLIR